MVQYLVVQDLVVRDLEEESSCWVVLVSCLLGLELVLFWHNLYCTLNIHCGIDGRTCILTFMLSESRVSASCAGARPYILLRAKGKVVVGTVLLAWLM